MSTDIETIVAQDREHPISIYSFFFSQACTQILLLLVFLFLGTSALRCLLALDYNFITKMHITSSIITSSESFKIVYRPSGDDDNS